MTKYHKIVMDILRLLTCRVMMKNGDGIATGHVLKRETACRALDTCFRAYIPLPLNRKIDWCAPGLEPTKEGQPLVR